MVSFPVAASATMEEWVPAPGTPQPHNEGYDSANDMIHLDSPASPDPLDDTLASHPLDSDSDRDVSHIAHETSSEDNDAVDLTGLRHHRVLHIHGTPDGVCEVHLLGTAHTSWDSARDAVTLVRAIQPDVVFLELCERRRRMLEPRDDIPDEPPSFDQMTAAWRRGEPLWGIMYAWVLATAAKELSVPPGAEFRAAASAAAEIPGCELVLGDRNVRTTLRRTWHALGTWERVRFVWGMLVSGFNMPSGDELKALIESMKDGDALTEAVKQLGKEFPSLLAPLIHERDAYMVAKLRDVAHRNGISSARPCRKIVAVVGAGHCEGMEEFIAVPWDHPSDTEALMAAMEEVPDPKDWERSRRAIALSVGLTLAGSIAGTVYVVSVFARRRR